MCVFFSNPQKKHNNPTTLNTNDETASDYGSGSPPSCDELLYTPPKLHRRINTNFSNVKLNDTSTSHQQQSDRYNFSLQMRDDLQCKMQHKSNKKGVCEQCNGGAGWGVKRKKDGFVMGEDCDVGIPIWSMDYMDNLIAVGCANGQVEFWEGTTGNLKVLFFIKKTIFLQQINDRCIVVVFLVCLR